jgi:hypothetical protein
MTAYATYSYYSGTYLGTAITSADFPRLALRASAVIDQLTFNRAATDTDNTTAIEMATCALAEELQTIDAEGAVGIQSESVGSHSVTYAQGSTMTLTADQRLAKVARLYLANTGLMYRGIDEE